MRQLRYYGGRRLSVDVVTPRELESGELRIDVDSAGVCKSDVYGYGGVNDRRDSVLGPGDALVMGHETAGVVCELGPGVTGPAVGTPVAVDPICGCGRCERCRAGAAHLCDRRTILGCAPSAPGGFADSMVLPAANVVPLSPGTPLELGALVEPLAVGAHGVRLAAPAPRSAVLVLGGGIIGLGAALAAQRATGGEVVVAEPLAQRRSLCRQLGLAAIPPEEVLSAGVSFDLALDCVARPETFAAAVAAVPPQGIVVLIGIWEETIPLPVGTVVSRETRIFGSYGYSHADLVEVGAWVDRREIELMPIIERQVGFAGIVETFEAYADGSLNAVRTLLRPALA